VKDLIKNKFQVVEDIPPASGGHGTSQANLIDPPNISLSRKFSQLGFAVLRGVFSEQEIAEFRAAAIERFPDNKPPYKAQFSNSMALHDPFDKIFTNERVISTLKELLGEDLNFLNDYAVHDSSWAGWHTDTTSLEINEFQDFHDFHWAPTFQIIQCALYLQSNDNGGFGLDVVPRSHVLDDPLAYYHLLQDSRDVIPHLAPPKTENIIGRAVRLDTKIGDMAFFHFRLRHRASPKTTPLHDQSERKIAVFAVAGAMNEMTRRYRAWLDEYDLMNDESRPDIPEDFRSLLDSVGVDII